jgi:hypothetical protein
MEQTKYRERMRMAELNVVKLLLLLHVFVHLNSSRFASMQAV